MDSICIVSTEIGREFFLAGTYTFFCIRGILCHLDLKILSISSLKLFNLKALLFLLLIHNGAFLRIFLFLLFVVG